MLFNSYQFIFLFLPITWAGYFLLGRFSTWSPVVWLALASLVFYSVSNWQFVACFPQLRYTESLLHRLFVQP